MTATPPARRGPLRGRPRARVEDARLLTGRGVFVDDVVLPGMLHACFVRSPFARAAVRASTRRPPPRCRASAACSPPRT